MKLNIKRTGFFAIAFLICIVTMSVTYSTVNDGDYRTAISIAEKKFQTLKTNRDSYKLITIENDILKNGDSWKFTYLSNDCISKEGLRKCKGGEIFIIVNVKSKESFVNFGE